MSWLGRVVVRTMDEALVTRERHPRLFAEALRRDRTCLQLARALERHKRREVPGRDERYEGDRQAGRVDLEWEDRQARKRAERWAAPTPKVFGVGAALPHHRAETKPDLDRDRRSTRRGLDVDVLYRLAQARTARISTVAAGNVEPSRGGGDGAAPPQQQSLEDDPRWDRHWGVVKRGLLLVHELLDEAEGHGPVVRDTTTEEMNRILLDEGEGLSCKEVAEKFPELTNGGRASVVAAVRGNQGSGIEGQDVLGYRVSKIDGHPSLDVQGPQVRRVHVD